MKKAESTKIRVSVVTGASTGIGKATIDLLRERGGRAYNLDIKPDESSGVFFIYCDVTDPAAVNTAISEVLKREGRIDSIFANAGVHLFANLEETTTEQLDHIMAINLKGVFFILQSSIPIMKRQKYGVILLMGSDQTLIGKGRSSAYGMTKGAIGQLTKSTAIDYASFNIRVNCLCAGTTKTPLFHNAVDRYHKLSGIPKEEIRKSLDSAQPIPRVAEPAEIAKVAYFLLSDESSYVTGALVAADGGYTSG
jgi:NAD(P)-dependent dehydrogenase (short-subunit alcohol dehydrogenase family)